MVEFSKVRVGEHFLWRKHLYMRSKLGIDSGYAVNLKNGNIVIFDFKTKVDVNLGWRACKMPDSSYLREDDSTAY